MDSAWDCSPKETKETEASSGTGRLGVRRYAPALSSLAPLAPDPLLGQKCSITCFSETHRRSGWAFKEDTGLSVTQALS